MDNVAPGSDDARDGHIPLRVVVIGAGISGLTLARAVQHLQQVGQAALHRQRPASRSRSASSSQPDRSQGRRTIEITVLDDQPADPAKRCPIRGDIDLGAVCCHVVVPVLGWHPAQPEGLCSLA